MFEIIGRWLIVLAFGCVVGCIYHIPRVAHVLTRKPANTKLGWREVLYFFIIPVIFIGIFWGLTCGKIVGEVYDIWANLNCPKWLMDTGAVCWLIAHIIAHLICYLIGLLGSMSYFSKRIIKPVNEEV